LIEYVCPVCGETIRVRGNNIHNHYLEDLSKKFEKEGYTIIQEGKMPERIKGWHGPVYEQLIKTVYEGEMKRIIWNEPDIFVLRDLNLAKVVEIIVEDGYRVTCVKTERIKKCYNPPEIIVFQPVSFLNIHWLPKPTNLAHYERILGYKPTSCIEIQEYFTKKWREERLNVIFWNETNI